MGLLGVGVNFAGVRNGVAGVLAANSREEGGSNGKEFVEFEKGFLGCEK